MKRIAVLGGGAWGTALAHIAAADGTETLLWMRDGAGEVAAAGENRRRLPGVMLNAGVAPTGDLGIAVAQADAVLVATPAQTLRAIVAAADAVAAPSAPLVLCAKGIERESGLMPQEVAAAIAPGRPVWLLSGPTFAYEAADAKPTACLLAGDGAPDQAAALAARLATPGFRLYVDDDPVGVALCGAAKNVIAIACGAAIGRGLGENARAALIARGLAEIGRLAIALGGRMETLAGLAGVGDLALTCASESSRNYAYGLALGRGAPGDARGVVEGALTAAPLVGRAAAHGVELPICAAVAAVTAGETPLDQAIDGLLNRPRRIPA